MAAEDGVTLAGLVGLRRERSTPVSGPANVEHRRPGAQLFGGGRTAGRLQYGINTAVE